MSKFYNLLIILLLLTLFHSSQTTKSHRVSIDENSDEDNFENNLEDERRTYDLNRLRHFLLTANAEQREARRKEQDFYKRELVYQSIDRIL